MYFQNRINQIAEAASIDDIATAFKIGPRQGNNGYRIFIDGNEFILVDDSHPDGFGSMEVAVVNQTLGIQVESITAGWIKDVANLARAFEKAITLNIKYCDARVPLKPADLVLASFICGCCSEWFRDNHAKQ